MDRTTVQLNLRLSPALRSRLQNAADQRGVSATQEINDRLERSFETEILGDGALLAILKSVALAMKITGQQAALYATQNFESAKDWVDNPYAFSQAAQAVSALLDAMKPQGDATPPRIAPLQTVGKIPVDLEAAHSNMGHAAASLIIEEIATGQTRSPGRGDDRPKQLRRGLGDIIHRVGIAYSKSWDGKPPYPVKEQEP